MISEITKTATKVRKWCVRNRSSMPLTLKGMCAIASFRLSCELDKIKIEHRTVVTDTHVWVEIDDLVIDITASQFTGINQPLVIDKFNYNQIFCKKWEIPANHRYFRNKKTMVNYLRKSGWPEFQIPKS